jgi:hypothetical protein
MWSTTKKLGVLRFVFGDSNTEKRRKIASIDPGRTSSFDFENSKVKSTDQERMHDG